MASLIIGILVIGIPFVIYVVCTAKRPEYFPEEYVGSEYGEDTLGDEVPQITLETTMGRILKLEKSMGEFLLNNGLHCVTCSSAKNESLEMACTVHGLNAEEMMNKIQTYLNEVYEA